MDKMPGSKNYVQKILSRARGEVTAASLVRPGWRGPGSKVPTPDPFETVAGAEPAAPEDARGRAVSQGSEPAAPPQASVFPSQPESRSFVEPVRREIRVFKHEVVARAGEIPGQSVLQPELSSPQAEDRPLTGAPETRQTAALFKPAAEPAAPAAKPEKPVAQTLPMAAEKTGLHARGTAEDRTELSKPARKAEQEQPGKQPASVASEVRQAPSEALPRKNVEPEKRQPAAGPNAQAAAVTPRAADQARPRLRTPALRPAVGPELRPQPRPVPPRPAVEAGPRLMIDRLRVEVIPAPLQTQQVKTTVIKQAPSRGSARGSGSSRGSATPLRFGLGQL